MTKVTEPTPPLQNHDPRFTKDDVPPDYIRHRGTTDPIKNGLMRVSLIVNTVEGLGFAGPRQVHSDEWALPQSQHGSIAYYKPDSVAPANSRMFHPHEPLAQD